MQSEGRDAPPRYSILSILFFSSFSPYLPPSTPDFEVVQSYVTGTTHNTERGNPMVHPYPLSIFLSSLSPPFLFLSLYPTFKLPHS